MRTNGGEASKAGQLYAPGPPVQFSTKLTVALSLTAANAIDVAALLLPNEAVHARVETNPARGWGDDVPLHPTSATMAAMRVLL